MIKKNSLILFAFMLFLFSCKQSDDALQISSNKTVDVVSENVILYDSLQIKIQSDIAAKNLTFCPGNDSIYNLIASSAQSNKSHGLLKASASIASTPSSGGPYTCTGYTSKTYLNSYKCMFTTISAGLQARGLQAYVTYIADVYLYKNRVTIPHTATIAWPSTINMSNMGPKPSNNTLYNYDAVQVSAASDVDTYDLTTQVTEISHLATGQQITTAYIPLNVVNPSTFQFEYAWTIFSW